VFHFALPEAKEAQMSLSGHLRELDSKHKKLEALLSEERRRPAANSFKVLELKKERLKLKEQLVALTAGTASSGVQ
jgi:hypothetical protein